MKGKILWGVVLTLLLTSCATLLEDSYGAVTPHTVAPLDEGSAVIVVESYHELVNALLYYVEEVEEEGKIRLLQYSKEQAKSHFAEAIVEILNETALGSYSVQSIQWDSNLILGNLEADIYITYEKTPEELENVHSLGSTTALVRAVSQVLVETQDSIVIKNSWASNDRSQIPTIMLRAYQTAAQSLVEIPVVRTSFYPKEGPWRILEMEFHYETSAETRAEQQEELAEEIKSLTSELWSTDYDDHFQALLSTLDHHADTQNHGDTTYHVLVEGKGNDQGYAFAFLALCQEMALSCQVVQGTYGEDTAFWNLITLTSGEQFHVFPSKSPNQGEDFPYYTAEKLESMGYHWNRSNLVQTSLYNAELLDLA